MPNPKGWHRKKKKENDNRYDIIRYWKLSNPSRGQYATTVRVLGPGRAGWSGLDEGEKDYLVKAETGEADEFTKYEQDFSNKKKAISKAFHIVDSNPEGLENFNRSFSTSKRRPSKPRGKTPERLKGRRNRK